MAAVAACCALGAAPPAIAISIELKDVAPDRIDRQRAAAIGDLPLPGTPDLADFEGRLAAKGMKAGQDVFLRVFKAESEVELWMRSGERFELFATYPMCHWSGTLGPKVREGDKQSPEGFYTIAHRQLRSRGRWPRSINFGFPNFFDKAHGRTGSYILMHGGCSSVGCFAMTNGVINEIHRLTDMALRSGQDRVHVHVFPFRMSEQTLEAHRQSQWYEFWQSLKQGYDAFESTRRPPLVAVCQKRYVVKPDTADTDAESKGSTASSNGPRRTGVASKNDPTCPPVEQAEVGADEEDAPGPGPKKPRRRTERTEARNADTAPPALKQSDVSMVFKSFE